MNHDVAVIGAGVTGLSVAWHLAANDSRSIVLLDGTGVGAGASSIQPGGVRQQWGTPMSCRLAVESFRFYQTFDERLKPPVSPSLNKCGYLFVAEAAAGFEQLQSNVALQNSEGIGSRLVGPDEAGELVPGLDAEGIVGAAWHDQDGYFDRPLAVISGFHAAALERGVSYLDSDLQRLERSGSSWQLTLSDGETIRASTVVLATSYETPKLLAPLDVEVPITKEPRYLFYSNPIAQRLLEPLVVFVDRHFASKQLADGSVLASDLTADGDPDARKSEWYQHIKESIRDRLPVLDLVSFPVMVEGFYDVTPDRQPIVTPVRGHEGLWLAAGLNGRGLMMAPAIGRLVAEAIETGALPAPLDELSLDRFGVDQLTPEPQVV
jgi:sarcosine oxidase, subunit beta